MAGWGWIQVAVLGAAYLLGSIPFSFLVARGRGIDVRTVSRPTAAIAGASFVGRHTSGTAQLVIDAGRDVIVGATFVGFEVAEMLQAATVAVVNGVSIPQLWECVAPFPTRSELWLRLLEAYEAG